MPTVQIIRNYSENFKIIMKITIPELKKFCFQVFKKYGSIAEVELAKNILAEHGIKSVVQKGGLV